MNGRGRFAPYVLGITLLALAGACALFALYAALLRENFVGFLVCTAVSGVLGGAMRLLGRARAEPTTREGIATVLLTWLLVPLIGALPYLVTTEMGFVDSFFESMSGFTATGATVITRFDEFPHSLLMWRALTQWIGGVGIIVMFVAVFPQLAIAGRQMFFAEVPGPTEDRLAPRLRHTAAAVLSIYSGLTVVCALAYWLFGMVPFDAIAHSFTTVAAGGFSRYAAGFAVFASPALEWVAVVFMFLAGVSLPLLYRTASGRPLLPLRNTEFRVYALIAVLASLALWFILWSNGHVDALRTGVFQAVSILTTSGFGSVDFTTWQPPALAVLLVLMLIGGSAGSASGGVKVARWLIIGRNTVREVRRVLHPRAVLPVRVGSRIVPEDVLRSVAAFITLYVGLFAFSTVMLVMFGSPLEVALTASISSIGNVGPGFGPIGPFGSYADLHPLSRILLTFIMYAGRLEVVTVFVVFAPGWWRLPRRSPLAWWRAR